MNNICATVDLMEFLSPDQNTCNLGDTLKLPALPTQDNPVKFFEVNIDDESQHAIHALKWQSVVSMRFTDLSKNNTADMIQKLNAADINNHLYSEKVVDTVTRLMQDISMQLTKQCTEQHNLDNQFTWFFDLQTPRTDYDSFRPFFYEDYYRGLPFWHMDGSNNGLGYRITIALKGEHTPFYTGLKISNQYFSSLDTCLYTASDTCEHAEFYTSVKISNRHSPSLDTFQSIYDLNLGMEGEGIVKAKAGQGVLFDQRSAIHATPYHDSDRILLVFTAHCR